MTDSLVTVIEALRRTQAKVAFYLEPGRDHHQGLQEIGAIVEDEKVRAAMELVWSPGRTTSSLVPDDPVMEVAPGPPLSR